jgi:DNA sulfur modification protein DndE
MKIKISEASLEFISTVYQPLRADNKAIIGRSAVCLALREGIPSGYKPDSGGVDLDDETILGDNLYDVVRVALNHRAGHKLDDEGYRKALKLHFDFGCKRLQELWEEAGRDQARFVSNLLKTAGDFDGKVRSSGRAPTMPVIDEPVKLQLLEDQEPWIINEAGHNGLLVISGKPGSGKSQLALDLLAQVARQGVRFVFFDLKGELEDDPTNPQQRANRNKFLELTSAEYVRLIQSDLPINPLVFDSNPAVQAKEGYGIASLIRAFAPQLGARQAQAIATAYQNLTNPDFVSLAQELQQNGANGVELAIIQKIVDLNLFASAQTGITPEKWLKSSLVIDFKEFGNDNDTKSLAVALILNFLMKRMNQNLGVKNGIQPLKMILFVDEAHLLLPKEGKAGLLGSLARQGRSWGFPVWLASQDADAFVTSGTNATNFAELAGCGIHFSPDTLSESEQRQILGSVLNRTLKQGEGALRLRKNLEIGIARQFWQDGGK